MRASRNTGRITCVCHVAGAFCGWVGCHPRCVIISYGRGIIVEGGENLNVRNSKLVERATYVPGTYIYLKNIVG